MSTVSTVGVRELRQNLSVYLRRVKQGETFEVTERGQRVAVLSPLPGADDVLARLVAQGLATPASGDLLEAPPPIDEGPLLSPILEELREERL